MWPQLLKKHINQFGMCMCVCERGMRRTQRRRWRRSRRRRRSRHRDRQKKNPTSCYQKCTSSRRETTQLATPSLGCLRRVFTIQRQMVSWQRRPLMSPRGGGEAHLSVQFYYNLPPPLHVHTQAQREKEGGRLGPPDRNIPLWVSKGVQHSQAESKKKR